MVRKVGAVMAALLFGGVLLFGAAPASADATPDPSNPFTENCDDKELEDVDLPATCMDGEWVSGSFGADDGIPGAFVVILVIGVVVAGLGLWWRVSTATEMARKAGMDEGQAATMAAFTDGGLEATYLASQLRPTITPTTPPTAQPADTATRLAELQRLRDSGAITPEEHDAQRLKIIEGI